VKRLSILAALAALVIVAAASAAPQRTLHPGDHGKRVCALQWLLSGHDPSLYRSIKTYHGPISRTGCVFSHATAVAVWNMKWRLGYPVELLHDGRGYTAGWLLFDELLGKQRRPIAWIATAAKRQARINHAVYSITACQQRVVGYAESQVGFHEIPWGSNWGPQVAMYQSVTGAFHAAWCVSFAQWVLWRAHVGPIANRSAGVFYVRGWAYAHGLLRARPEPGTVVLFLFSAGHAGIVTHVTQTGFDTVEGNYADQVARVHHSLTGSPVAFVYLPGCS
jgi:CHAP domain